MSVRYSKVYYLEERFTHPYPQPLAFHVRSPDLVLANMHLEDVDANDLKTWVVGRLQDISDADSDVLADYVLALLKTDTPDAQLKVDVSENLEDFLKDSKSWNKLNPQTLNPDANI